MIASSDIRAYVTDVIVLLKQDAQETKRLCASSEGEERIFMEGKLLGYNEVISSMRNQAIAFGIDLSDLRLGDIDPDKDLVP
jgi:hypothetical protein